MKKSLILSFLVLGLTSMIVQLRVISEAVISFYGNELFIGLTLGFWLIWVGLGSIFLAKIISPARQALNLLAFCHLAIPLLYLADVFLLRLARQILGNWGQAPDILQSLIFLFFALAPLGLFLGLQFSAAGNILLSADASQNFSVKPPPQQKAGFSPAYFLSRGYLYETVGLILGGILYSAVLVYQNSYFLFFLLLLFNLLALFFLLPRRGLKITAVAIAVLSLVFMLNISVNGRLDILTANWRFLKQKLITSQNSKFGNIAVAQFGNEFNFYESGLLVGSTRENFTNEEVIHLPLLFSAQPKKILLIGGGFSGAVNEILKYPVQDIFYVELDPGLIAAVRGFLPENVAAGLNNPKVKIIYDDAYHFVKTAEQNFDVIILNLPNPETAFLNRYYTRDFFRLAKIRLNQQGLLAVYLTSQANYYSPALASLLVSIDKSLKETYSSTLALPEDNLILLGSNVEMDYDSSPLIQRFDLYGLNNKFITKEYIIYRLTNDRITQLNGIFEKYSHISANTNGQPRGYWWQNLFWLASHYPNLAALLLLFGQIDLKILAVAGLLVLLALFCLLKAFARAPSRLLIIATIIPEFSLLAAEVMFIFLFQTTFGFLYYQLGLILTAILGGLGLGTWLVNYLSRRFEIRYQNLLHLYIAFSFYYLFLAIVMLYQAPCLEQLPIFYLLVTVCGFFVGLKFPIISRFYFDHLAAPDEKTGVIYGADLLGSSLGAIFTSLFFLPLLGLSLSILFLAGLNFIAFLGLFSLRRNFA